MGLTAHCPALDLFLESKTGTPTSTALLQGLQQMQGISNGLGVDGACSWVLRVSFRRESSVPTQLTREESAAKDCQLRGEELLTEPPAQRDSCCWEDQTSVGSYALLMVAELVTA